MKYRTRQDEQDSQAPGALTAALKNTQKNEYKDYVHNYLHAIKYIATLNYV